jgi:hypothetical protein
VLAETNRQAAKNAKPEKSWGLISLLLAALAAWRF